MAASPLRLMIFDRTCTGWRGLSKAWSAGALLYRGLDRFDATYGAASWEDALGWIATFAPERPIGEIQYWGHGRWGRVLVAEDALDTSALDPGHRLHERVLAVRDRLVPEGRALVWLRACEAFGADSGHVFAARLADTLRARVAGHTVVIGAVQSCLRTLRPGLRPTWSATEGIREGSAAEPRRAFGSSVFSPRTVSFLTNEIPEAWFAEDGAAR